MRAAAIQVNANNDKDRNLELAARLVADAAADGADLVVLPEKWNLLGSGEEIAAGAERLEDGPSVDAARAWARDLSVHLLAGSISERVPEADHPFNTSVLIDPEGEIVATYRKIHMFDVDVGGVAYRESEHEQAGNEIVTGDAGGVELGLSICYDLRFPELYRILSLRGARVITVPAAFTFTTGRAHWEVLLRARAIENQAFVVAPNQYGEAAPSYHSYGNSMIVDPWGVVLARGPEAGEGQIAADLDLERQAEVRESLPSLANRRPSAYGWPEGAPV
jgi:predicted amidohydrolase